MKTRTIMTNFMARAMMTLLVMALTTTSAWADDVEINENTFPDGNFRDWVLSQDFGEDGWLSDEEREEAERYIDVSYCGISDLTGIEYFTGMKYLDCDGNSLTTLDLSHNNNLERVNCSNNQLTSLIIVSPMLEYLDCSQNQLTTLDLSQCTALNGMDCSYNRIRGWGTDALIANLPEREDGDGTIDMVSLTDPKEQNAITTTQVAAANAKGWEIWAGRNSNWNPYEGLPVLTLADNDDNGASLANAGYFEAATLEGRTFYMDGDWNTLCLPFSVGDPDADDGQHFDGTPLEGFAVKELDIENEYEGHKTGFADGTLYLNFRDANSIEAGVPYLVKNVYVDASTLTYEATDGTGGFEGEEHGHLVDGKPRKKWCTDSGKKVDGAWFCEFMTSAPVCVTGYTLTTGNDISDNNDRNPLVWSLQAKVNSTDTWTEIDSRDAWGSWEDELPEENTVSKDYDIAADLQGTYQYFHFEVTDTWGNIMELGELTLQGTVPVSSIESPTFYGVTVNAADPTVVSSDDGTVSFVGCYSPFTLYANDRTKLYLGADNTLYYPSADVTINSCRAYFTLNGIMVGDISTEANAFVLNFGDETTSIEHLPLTIDHSDGAWYSIDGRKLNAKPTTKGIYINNGKKIVAK